MPAQVEWLKECLPAYMTHHPKSEETRHLIETMLTEFDALWPMYQELWPGCNTNAPLTNNTCAKLLAKTSIYRAVSEHARNERQTFPLTSEKTITSYLLWTTQYKLCRKKNETGKEPAKWFWYWGVGQT